MRTRQIIDRLFEERLSVVRTELQDLGWNQVHVSADHPTNLYYFSTLSPANREPTEAEAFELDTLTVDLDTLENDEQAEPILEKIEQIKAGLQHFPAEVRAQNAVYCYIAHDGELATRYVQLGDDTKAKAKKDGQGLYSKVMIERMSAIRTLALQDAIIGHP